MVHTAPRWPKATANSGAQATFSELRLSFAVGLRVSMEDGGVIPKSAFSQVTGSLLPPQHTPRAGCAGKDPSVSACISPVFVELSLEPRGQSVTWSTGEAKY